MTYEFCWFDKKLFDYKRYQKSVYKHELYWYDNPTGKISAASTERWKKTFILSEFV